MRFPKDLAGRRLFPIDLLGRRLFPIDLLGRRLFPIDLLGRGRGVEVTDLGISAMGPRCGGGDGWRQFFAGQGAARRHYAKASSEGDRLAR
jgi:hypothetical protein